LLWLLVNLGIVPLANATNSFAAIKSSGGSVDGLINAITAIVKNDWVTIAITSHEQFKFIANLIE
jgi:hypothetical protein